MGVILTTPMFFSRIAKKWQRAAPPFCIPFHASISHPSRKFQSKVISGQVTRTGQVTLPKKNSDFAMITVFEVPIRNFQLIKASVPTKRVSRNFDFGDLRSGQFWDLTIIRQWENVHMLFFSNVRVGTCYLSEDVPTLGHSRWPVLSFDPLTPLSGHSRSYEVTLVFVSNFW